MAKPEERLKQLGFDLPELAPLPGNFVHAVAHGDVLQLSGKGPLTARGKVGQKISKDDAKQAAQEVGLILIRVMKSELGDLSRVRQILKVFGMVNATDDFTEHPYVIDGCSNLFVDVFGDAGRHTRCAVGMASLPFDIPVEIECTVVFGDAQDA
jgi:enamine deaminase RidA (YjgF/YER057c/UK114 family)